VAQEQDMKRTRKKHNAAFKVQIPTKSPADSEMMSPGDPR
jgi:hypothetical protein